MFFIDYTNLTKLKTELKIIVMERGARFKCIWIEMIYGVKTLALTKNVVIKI